MRTKVLITILMMLKYTFYVIQSPSLIVWTLQSGRLRFISFRLFLPCLWHLLDFDLYSDYHGGCHMWWKMQKLCKPFAYYVLVSLVSSFY